MRHSMLVIAICILGILSGIYYHQKVQVKSRFDGVPSEVRSMYLQWKVEYGRLYGTPTEEQYRMRVFYNQKVLIDTYNSDYEEKYQRSTGGEVKEPMFEMNMFGDLTEEEFAVRYTGESSSELIEDSTRSEEDSKPVMIAESDHSQFGNFVEEDQNKKMLGGGYEIRVRNQGSCGSCWAFSGIGSVEKLVFDQTQQRLDLSQQELVDCVVKSNGCNGGKSEYGMEYISKNGISLISNYPYMRTQGACKSATTQGRIRPKVNVPQIRSFALSDLVSYTLRGYHPFANVYAAGKFKYFSKSEEPFRADLSGECQMMKNHGIVIVAYSKSQGATILNSWGTGWGLNGLKNVIPCSEDNLFGAQGRLAHPYP